MPVDITREGSLLHYTVTDFTGAGQDSTTSPPAQSPSMFELLTNVMPIRTGVLERRWGYSLLSNPSLAATRQFSYRNDTTDVRYLILSSTSSVKSVTEAGAAHQTILTPGAGAIAPRMVNSRDYAYFLDAVEADMKKWSSATSTTLWGIERPGNIYNNATAATSPTAAANNTLYSGAAWVNPNNCFTSNGVFASAASDFTTNVLLATGFGFAIPDEADIMGIKVEVQAKAGMSTSATQVAIPYKNGSFLTSNNSATANEGPNITNSLVYYSFGGSAHLWNDTWTAADINASNFGFGYYIDYSTFQTTTDVDHIRVTVYYSLPIQIGAFGAGNVTLTVGRKYYYVYKNSSTGHVSDLSDVSASTGPITTDNIPLSGITASSDSQVDRKLILATADGGDEQTLYLLVDLPNATTTYTDNTPEEDLLLRPIYLSVDDEGDEHGVTDNTPPPNGRLVAKHRGRLYIVSEDQRLYFSKNIAELTTASGTVAGRYEECWPADYYIDLSEGAETITGLLSDGNSLYIGTERHIRKLDGDGPDNFSTAEVVFNEVGLLNQETLRMAFIEGQPVGAFWLTPDFKVMGSDFNTYEDVGKDIKDVLDSITAANASESYATFFADEGYNLYLLAIPTNGATDPNTICVLDLATKKWVVWSLADNVASLHYNINSSGNPQLLLSAQTGKYYQFGSSHTQDRVSDTPVTITMTVQTSWLSLGAPHTRKILNELEVGTSDTALVASVYGATLASGFSSPATVKSGTLVAGPLDELKLYLAGSTTKDRFYRLRFVSTQASGAVTIDRYSLEAARVHEV